MSFVMIPEELLSIKLSSAQFRALIQIINNTYSSGKYAGCCCLGYQNLANLCFTTKAAIINTVKQLDELGFIEIDKREKFNRSNALRLTLESGFKRFRGDLRERSGSDLKGYENNTYDRYENNTDEGYLKDTEGYLKDTQGYENNTPHIDLKFKNQDLKIKTCACVRNDGYLKDTDENTAPAGVAAGLSKPSQRAGEGLAKEVCAEAEQLDIDDLCLWQGFVAAYPRRYPWFQLVRVKNQLLLRGIGKMGDSMLTAAWDDVSGWFALRGRHVAKAETNKRFNGEIIVGR